MRVAVLFSGGKDSVRTTHFYLEKGYDVKYLVTMLPKREDSWLFHFPNIHLTELSAEAIGITRISRETSGDKEEEIEDLNEVLKNLDVDAIACGGIFSNYQRKNFKKVCEELGFKFLTPFWHTDPEKFLKDTIDLGFDVRIVGVYAEGFDESWLERKLDEKCIEDLKILNKKYEINLCGEGGDYETLTLDCSCFKKRLEILKSTKVWEGMSGYLRVDRARLVPKENV
ncbi:MAG: TIGR00289 family protein [Candidatus Bathyarchaeota archaeon]|nr:TIGR00289 family protein [Candidatus Bathyarchaeota archaeon]